MKDTLADDDTDHGRVLADRITVAHFPALFAGFACSSLADVYIARDHLAHAASEALADLDPHKTAPLALRDLQAALRAAFAVALVNGLPTALLIDSARLWKAKLEALLVIAAEEPPEQSESSRVFEEREPRASEIRVRAGRSSGCLSFDLLGYDVDDHESVLVAALSISRYDSDVASVATSALLAIDGLQLEFPPLSQWRDLTAESLLRQRDAFLLRNMMSNEPQAPSLQKTEPADSM